MKKVCVSVVTAMFIALVVLSFSNAYADEYDKGKSLFENKCQICHGANGKGNGPAAGALNPKPMNFNSAKFWQGDVDKKIKETLRKGKGEMPAFNLSDEEVKAIIDYMAHAFKKE
jgi:mono/diheme cytochrome c family protein